ncbi:MAG: hypothetical protein ACXVB9_07385 [Bdellovibrionota bacterium]
MRAFSILALLPLLAHADDSAAKRVAAAPPPAAEDIRTFGGKDMVELSSKIGKALHKCKELANGGLVEISFINATSESIDKDAFIQAIKGQLTPGAEGPGKKYDLQVKLASTIKQTGNQYEGNYTINAHLKQADEVLCVKSTGLVKKGTLPK